MYHDEKKSRIFYTDTCFLMLSVLSMSIPHGIFFCLLVTCFVALFLALILSTSISSWLFGKMRAAICRIENANATPIAAGKRAEGIESQRFFERIKTAKNTIGDINIAKSVRPVTM